MKKILITGASGFVGRAFVARWQYEYKLLTPLHRELDITDETSVDAYMMAHTPDVVLHLAALSNTWYCEQHPDESFLVNVVGSENVARAAARYGAKFIFFSSDQVYNGNTEQGPLSEAVSLSPVNHYGRHKLEAEQRIAEILPSAVILRVTWLYDAPQPATAHADFVSNMINAVKEGIALTVPVREYRGITWLRDVVGNLPHAFTLQGGVYNLGSGNNVNTYETAYCFYEMLYCGDASRTVTPDYERYALAYRNLSMDTDKIFRASGGCICFPSTIDGLRLFVEMVSLKG